MNSEHPSPNDWKPCPAGSLSGLTVSLKHQRRRIQRQRWAGGVSAVALLVVGGWFWMNAQATRPGGDATAANLSCREVLRILPEYVGGHADPALARRIRQHLDHCPPCHQAWVKLSPASRPQHSAGHCPDCGESSWTHAVVQAETAVADVVSLLL